MSNFNAVFLAVKKQCENQKNFAEVHSFEAIAKDAKVPLDKLEIYLNHLQDMELIKFSMEEKYIHLTAFGKKQKALIKDK